MGTLSSPAPLLLRARSKMAASDPIETDWVTGFITTSLQRALSVPNGRSLQAILSRRAKSGHGSSKRFSYHNTNAMPPILARTSALSRMKARTMTEHHLVILQQGS